MPRFPDVFGQPVKPISASTSRTSRRHALAVRERRPRLRVDVDPQLVRALVSRRRDGQGWKSTTARFAAQATCASSVTQSSSACRPDGKRHAGDLDPLGPFLGHALLVDRLALDAVREAAELGRPLVQRTDDSLADGQVVPHEVELRLAARREEDLVRDSSRGRRAIRPRAQRMATPSPRSILAPCSEETAPHRPVSLEPLDDYVVIEPSDEETETRVGADHPREREAGCRTGIVTAAGAEAGGVDPGRQGALPEGRGLRRSSGGHRRARPPPRGHLIARVHD